MERENWRLNNSLTGHLMVFSSRHLPNHDAAKGRRLRLGGSEQNFLETHQAKEAKTRSSGITRGRSLRAYNTLPDECSGGL